MKKTILDLYAMKTAGEKAVWMVTYDALFASYAEKAGIDMLLVGDSVGMGVYGYAGTVRVTMDMMVLHAQAVRRGAPNTYIIGDMPFGSYHISCEDAVANAVRLVKECDVDAIKLEGGMAVADKVRAIANAGIVVFGHVGLTPQSSAALGGFKAQGKTTDSARAVIEDAVAVYRAGARVVLLEGVPEEVCAFVHRLLPCPVYGIGAGAQCDGQVLLHTDLLGMFTDFTPKFAKQYKQLAHLATEGIREYIDETKSGAFPAAAHKYTLSDSLDAFDALFAEMADELEGSL